jgi:ATP-dependent Clp protease ATP-binding subunit ClpA
MGSGYSKACWGLCRRAKIDKLDQVIGRLDRIEKRIDNLERK